ncbi:MAG: sulfatase-like hydrolase/transferase [Acidobacteria bacterium]|nr:sulfatase-like hydrolase/transferase [Acidobacteriota bacterium]
MPRFSLLFGCLLWMLASSPAGARPNLVLIMADDMGFECLSPYGGKSYSTPNMERMARDGMLFTHCYSQPVCTPSRNKIMTGRRNTRNYRSFGALLPTEPTFAKVLKAAGYRTAVAGKWQLSDGGGGPLGSTPEQAGFDEHFLWAYEHDMTPKQWDEYVGARGSDAKTSRYWHPAILHDGKLVPTGPDDFGPDLYADFLLDFIERNKDQPFFAYYPMALIHGPFVPTPHSSSIPEEDKHGNKKKYMADMVAYSDFLVGRILDKLDQLGLSENTLVLFTGDNGTTRGIRSQIEGRTVIGAKATPVDGGTHVGLLARWKGAIEPGSKNDDLIDFSDFLPTLAEAGDAPLPSGVAFDGRSFLAQLRGLAGDPRDWLFMDYDKDPDFPPEKKKWPPARFVRTKRYKLYADGRFFDVPNDWEEQSPITPGQAGAEGEQTRAMLQAVLDQTPPWKK